MSVRQPRPRMNQRASLLGMCPPMNDPVMPRMPGPLLQAPYELLPPPSSMERMNQPPSPPPRSLMHAGFRRDASPPRSMMHTQSHAGFHREPSPPRFVMNSFFAVFNLSVSLSYLI